MMSDSDPRSAESSAELRRRLSKEEWRRLAEANEQEWLAFPGLPGTHLSWRKWGSGRWELVSADGEIWASSRGKSITVSGLNYERRSIWRNKRRNYISDRRDRTELVDSEGRSVLSWTGSHFMGRARTVLSIGGTNFIFPVRGSKYRAKTVMPAVEIGGSHQPIA